MKEPKSLFPKAGQTALLWMNDKVLLKRDYKEASAIYTRFDSFIGTKEEVESKIVELGLKETEKSKIPTVSQSTTPAPTNPMQSAQSEQSGGIISNTWNTITSIFTNKQ